MQNLSVRLTDGDILWATANRPGSHSDARMSMPNITISTDFIKTSHYVIDKHFVT
jgi:hypothetical protein